jgi:tetratricopeptide (TPR) repeat protein
LKRLFTVIVLLLLTVTLMSCLPGCLSEDQRYLKEGDGYYDAGDKLRDEGKGNEALKQYDLAAQKYTKALEVNPQLIPAYMSRGAAYTEIAKYDEALIDLGRIIQMDPENTMAYYQRSMTNIFAQKYDAAIADCNKAIELGLQNQFVYFNRGKAYEFKGSGYYDFAIADYLKAKSQTSNADFNRMIDQQINNLRTAMGK